MRFRSTALVIATALVLGACQTTESVYRDTNAESEVKTTRWQAHDLQSTAIAMVDSFLNDPYIIGDDQPVIRFTGIKNKTSQHIDTKALSDRIRAYLIRSHRVRVLTDWDADKDQRKKARAEAKYSHSRAVDKATRRSLRKSKAAGYHLFGEVSEIHQTDANATERSYQIIMNLHDIETDELIWSDIKDIQKVKKRSFF